MGGARLPCESIFHEVHIQDYFMGGALLPHGWDRATLWVEQGYLMGGNRIS